MMHVEEMYISVSRDAKTVGVNLCVDNESHPMMFTFTEVEGWGEYEGTLIVGVMDEMGCLLSGDSAVIRENEAALSLTLYLGENHGFKFDIELVDTKYYIRIVEIEA